MGDKMERQFSAIAGMVFSFLIRGCATNEMRNMDNDSPNAPDSDWMLIASRTAFERAGFG